MTIITALPCFAKMRSTDDKANKRGDLLADLGGWHGKSSKLLVIGVHI